MTDNNNNETTAEKIYNQAVKLTTNLRSKGITDIHPSMGLSDLIDEIPNIPSSGIFVETNITLSANYNHISKDEKVVLGGVLSASSDGNVDLVGKVANAIVKLYNGDTMIGTVTTNALGGFNKEITLDTLGTYSFKAVYDGATGKYDNCESSTVNVTCGLDTLLTITPPVNLVYSDNFNITGLLTDEEDTPLNNKTVSLMLDGEEVDTETTDNNGEFSFTHSPVKTGNHTFQILFNGDNSYGYSTSSDITRFIDRETSVLNLTSPVNNTSIYSDGSLTVAGTLVDNDGTAMQNKEVIVKQGNTLIDTLTTNSSGAFTGSINGEDLVSGALTVSYEGSDEYTSSSNNVNITINNPSITLVSDKQTIEQNDNESCTFTATVSSAVTTGKTISLYKMTGNVPNPVNDTLIGTMTDNEDGTYESNYTSTGAGTVGFYAVMGGIASEVYSITDNPYAIILTITGDSFSSYNTGPFYHHGGDAYIDWGDGNIENYNYKGYEHTYSTNDNYIIKIVGSIYALANTCFRNCSGLTSINIPSNVTSIGELGFMNCNGLTNINIPNSVTSIGASCFWNCYNLTSLNIPNSMTSISRGCFWDCSGLTSINIPNSITSLSQNCFYGCNSLNDVQLYWTSNPIWTNMVNNNNTIYTIPYGTTQIYVDAGYPSAKLVERPPVSLTSDKSILSYADEESCTLTATLSGTGTLTGQTVQLYNQVGITKDPSNDTLIGTMVDIGEGAYEYDYDSSGAGDLNLYAKYGNILSETYSISDIWCYDSCTSDKGHWSDNTGLAFSNDGMLVTKDTILDILYPSDYVVEFTLVEPTGNYGTWTGSPRCANVGVVGDNGGTLYYQTANPYSYSTERTRFNANDKIKFVVENGSASIYLNDVLKRTVTATNDKLELFKSPDNANHLKIKNLTIKAL